MSPEQANGESLDGRSDLFAVGVMLWELLVGRRLFVGQDTRATLAAVLFGQIPRPRSLRGEVPKDLERIVMKLLERELPARYLDAEAAIKDLLACSSAPRDGRELLKTTLQERFPQQAPIRHSVLKSRASAGTPPGTPQQGHPQQGYPPQPGYPQPGVPPHLQPTQQPVHAQQTIADGNIGRPAPHAALPSIGSQRGAQTGTMQPHVGPAAMPLPRGHKGRGKTAIVIASIVAASAVLFAVIATVARGDRNKTATVAQGSDPGSAGSGSGVGPGSATLGPGSAAGEVLAPPPDAPPAPPIDAGLPDAALAPLDAGPGETKKDATVLRPGEKRLGRLVVKAFPVLTVFVDNKKIHDTPVDMPLTVGKHKLRLVNSEGRNEALTVTIEENKPTIIDRN
jgi:hypothetical protein